MTIHFADFARVLTVHSFHNPLPILPQMSGISDPDVVFVSASCPRENIIQYALDRLTTAKPATSEDGTAVRKVSLYGVNSAIPNTVTIAEIIKRRCPTAVSSCKLGSAVEEATDEVSSAAGKADEERKRYAIQVDFVALAIE
jgi:hypothetical protein